MKMCFLEYEHNTVNANLDAMQFFFFNVASLSHEIYYERIPGYIIPLWFW